MTLNASQAAFVSEAHDVPGVDTSLACSQALSGDVEAAGSVGWMEDVAEQIGEPLGASNSKMAP